MGENLLDDKMENRSNTKRECPVISLNCEGIEIRALVDSGSQITAISETKYDELKGRGISIPVLPLNNVNIVTATQSRSTKINKQIMLEI